MHIYLAQHTLIVHDMLGGVPIGAVPRCASSAPHRQSGPPPISLPSSPYTLGPRVPWAGEREQEAWIREWLRRGGVASAGVLQRLQVCWYPAVYEEFLGAIIQRPRVDMIDAVPPSERDVVILEEPGTRASYALLPCCVQWHGARALCMCIAYVHVACALGDPPLSTAVRRHAMRTAQ